jgi:hypothetical protein
VPVDVQRWAETIRADPDAYRLPAFGPWMTPERAAACFAAGPADELTGQPSPALCRRCGRVPSRYVITRPGPAASRSLPAVDPVAAPLTISQEDTMSRPCATERQALDDARDVYCAARGSRDRKLMQRHPAERVTVAW